ncbi:hypothetical protein MIND_00072900 [Mycena indigotica]|uniref:DNA repair protein Rad26 n=1 Tax=Mycena indigotica TaxID=2126181 RepID=A0A8H6TDU1_9AGAR|nr:uncharacterized protein MIND_00072900 [Mycena indigotica]KAF7315576.1 hypothetical protein MIND_00072900 [Mycena indigotica]
MSDDYLFDDDLVFDDGAVAALDTLEKSYFSETAPPPPKRQKTNNGLEEDLPDISVDINGSYAFLNSAQSTSANVPTRPAQLNNTIHRPQPPTNHIRAQPTRRIASNHTQRHFPPPNPSISQTELEDLRRQVQELTRKNEHFQSQIDTANAAKWSAQGEVTILRAGINKTNAEHAQQVERLRKAKEESEAKQIAAQKEMAAEMDRLKASRRFQDLDNIARKVSMSARSKRVMKEVPSTPLPQQGWNDVDNQTPLQPRTTHFSRGPLSPQNQLSQKKLLGFRNAFIDTPIRSSQPHKMETPQLATKLEPIPFPQFPEPAAIDDDTIMEGFDDGDPNIPVVVEEPGLPTPIGEPFNWKAELARILLTFSAPWDPTPVIKLLSGLTMPPELIDSYSDTTTRLFDVIASTTSKDYELCVSSACSCLTALATSIIETQQFQALAVLLCLMSTLARSLPTFSMVLLNQSLANDDEQDMVETLHQFLRQLVSSTGEKEPTLVHELFSLLEEWCWNLKDDGYSRFSAFCEPQLLAILLDASQPSWLLCRVTSFLLQAASHVKLAQKLTSPQSTGKETQTLPHLDRLAVLLIDQTRNDDEGMQMKRNIITFFGVLAVAQTEIHNTLVGYSTSLFPALAAFSSRLTTPFWEDPDGFLIPEEVVDKSIYTLSQTLLLFHYLVFGLEGDVNLRHKFQHATPSRAFIGITHVFLVTFGRLGCADAPDWMTDSQKRELESLGDMAQDLVDLVVDGPELDSLWAAFQADSDDSITVDDAVALEARLVGAG